MDDAPNSATEPAADALSAVAPCNLFAYGTLMVPGIWSLVTGLPFSGRPVRLHGFVRYQVAGADFPGILASPDRTESVEGFLFENLSAATIQRLDAYEDAFYERREVEVAVDEGLQSVTCQTYVVPESRHHVLSDKPWDLAWFEEHALARYLSQFG